MSERIKFYMDEHVARAVTSGLRRRDVDVLTTQEAGMMSATDADHLSLAFRSGRVIFTQDDDFLRLHAQGYEHTGIVYTPQHTRIGEIVRGLMLIHQLLDPEDMLNHVEFL